MTMAEATIKCPICGKPYVVYPMYVGDQSACPKCRAEARRAVERPSTIEERRAREQFFGLGATYDKHSHR